jgi:hypothetical protein
MESVLNKPNFTDATILKLTNSSHWIPVTKHTKKYITLKESTIEISLYLDLSYNTSPPLEIMFRDNKDNLIGAFTYYLFRDPIDAQCSISRAECLFLEGFGTDRSYMTTSKAVEKLMEYPDIKEWLLWNQP